ncbi:MAG TPA: dihydrolipoyl dehydrogenase [Firmicutes bacterium]|nr:dihydrolipoyl dehydrogenase [Bacillota bacterium]
MTCDLVVLGGGPGGYVAAIRARQLGLSVTLVESDSVGGTCLNRGCIPTKVLVGCTSILAMARRARDYGVEIPEAKPDFKAMKGRKDRVVSRLRAGVEFLLKKNRVNLVRGRGRLVDSGVEVDGAGLIRARRVIVATGSRPQLFPGFAFDGRTILTSEEILEIEELPGSLIIVGGGVIGCEFACIFSELGVKVTIVELMPRILPMEDADIAATLSASFKKRGISIRAGEKITSLSAVHGKAVALLESGETIEGDRALISVGRVPNSRGLGLEDIGVSTGKRGEILVDDEMRTEVPHVYAIGDVTGKVLLAHAASAQGLAAAQNVAGDLGIMSSGASISRRTVDYSAIPAAIFTSPEIGTVGLTVDAAREAGIPVKTGKFPFAASGKAVAMGEIEGFIKLVVREDTGEVVGAQIIGPCATELVSQAAVAIRHGLTVSQFVEVVRPHPTLSEALGEAGEAAEGMAIHI